jgi:hypothetical protein
LDGGRLGDGGSGDPHRGAVHDLPAATPLLEQVVDALSEAIPDDPLDDDQRLREVVGAAPSRMCPSASSMSISAAGMNTMGPLPLAKSIAHQRR